MFSCRLQQFDNINRRLKPSKNKFQKRIDKRILTESNLGGCRKGTSLTSARESL